MVLFPASGAAAMPAVLARLAAAGAVTRTVAASEPLGASVGRPRSLADASDYSNSTSTQIYMVPDILEGLLVGLLLLVFVSIGLYCTMSINTPDVLHSVALPAGKEY